MQKQSWEEISSLDIEAENGREKDPVENRRTGRVSTDDIKDILMEKIENIHIRVATRNRGVLPLIGTMEDVHCYGMCFSMNDHGLKIDESISIGTVIGNQKITSQAIVRWTKGDKVGIEFRDTDEDDVTFLKDLYSAKIFKSWV